jgi:serine/threonine protein kinase
VALKVLTLNNGSMDAATAVERFRREARYAHQLRHKNIVPVLNFGQDGPLLYLVMPLVTDSTLKALLKAQQPLPTAQAMRYLNDLAAAIDSCRDYALRSRPHRVHSVCLPSQTGCAACMESLQAVMKPVAWRSRPWQMCSFRNSKHDAVVPQATKRQSK